jgi:PAS domain S-box-containing protein
MNALVWMNTFVAGFFACAAIHYGLYWGFSRRERVFLVFSVQCVAYTAFCLAISSFFEATTIAAAQRTLNRFVTIGVLLHVLLLQFFTELGERRDRLFRAIVAGALVFLAVLNQWAPLRGTVLELRTMSLPGGGTGLLAVRTPPGTSLAILYALVLVVEGYGFFVARKIWRRDHVGGIFVAFGTAVYLAGALLGFLVDFAHLRAPYSGALPHALFVVCAAVHLSRAYAARGARVVATKRQFEAVFDFSPIGKALVAVDGRLLRVNRTFCQTVKSTADVLCGRRLYDIFLPDDGGSIETQAARLLRGELRTYAVETRLVRTDADPLWALLVLSVVPDHRGQPIQLIAQIQDVTEVRAYREKLEELVATRTRELRQAKEEAERASQAKSWFLTHMSHEIRSPLQVMLLNAAALDCERPLSAEQLSCIESIQSSGEHLATLINNVLDMSTVEAGRVTLVEEPFDLSAVLDDVAHMFIGQAAVNGTNLRVERGPELPAVLLGDGGKVKQIIINLVSNAIKFTRQGSVSVTADWRVGAEPVGVVEVVVEDTGKGIGRQDLARIFRPFEQLEGGANSGGTGLGLTISLAYARLMGGDITVDSRLDVGSRFKLTFVAKRGTAAQARQPSGPLSSFESLAPTRAKVLVVDDVDAIRHAIAALLERNAFETRTATDGPTALLIEAQWRPDVILVDLRMPGMNGIEVMRRVRATGSPAIVGALTAGAFRDDESEARNAGADFFIRKPFKDRDLLDQLTRVARSK